jgi:polar amino acid transport system permease protein
MEQLYLIWQGMPSLLSGTLVTIELTIYFLALGFLLGILLALGRVYGPLYLQLLVIIPFERLFRAIPALVLLFLFYFGSSFFHINISAFMAAVLAMGLRSAAYQSEIFRGAIQTIGEDQMKAARSLGMNTLQSIRYVILPQALRLSIPSWANEYAVVLKDTSLAYAVGVTELLRQGRYIVARTFGNALLVYTVCALIYLY